MLILFRGSRKGGGYREKIEGEERKGPKEGEEERKEEKLEKIERKDEE